MNLSEFSIGVEFWCGEKKWRCTDIGTRVVTAICIEPRQMVRVAIDDNDPTKRTTTRYHSDDPRDLNGPPYGVAECVFDEYDQEACSLEFDS
jgi:hypothetical protein